MTKKNKKNVHYLWSSWYRFDQIYDYNGPIRIDGGKTGRNIIKEWTDQEGIRYRGFLHTDNGFRLRGTNRGSFKESNLDNDLDRFPPLELSDIGVYAIKIGKNYDDPIAADDSFYYIGQTHEDIEGIHGRLKDHLCKIAGFIQELGYGSFKGTEKFTEMRDFFKEKSINTTLPKFFKELVSIAFVKVDSKKKKKMQEVHRIEGMCMLRHREIFGQFPELNTTDETKGSEGYPPSHG